METSNLKKYWMKKKSQTANEVYMNHPRRIMTFLQDAYCNVYRPQRMIIPGISKQKPSPRLAQRNWKNAKWRENLGDRFYAGKRQKCKPASFCTRNGTNAQWQHIFRNVDFLNSGTRFNTLFREQMKSGISNNESSERLECPHMS